MSQKYRQDEISERYAQPFRSVARTIASLYPDARTSKRKIRKAAETWFRLFRKPFSRYCIYPEVLLVGASKCGTSSMANHLSSHPDCMAPFYKEIRYFDSSSIPANRLDEYRAHFPTRIRRRLKEWLSGRNAWTADFSPTYYDHPHAPKRVLEVLGPDVKLIMLVRNPVDRAYSQYRFQRGIGNEPVEDFEKALALERQRLAGEEARQQVDAGYFSRRINHFGYLTRSLYLPYIKNWHQHFHPTQLHVVRLEDFIKSPQPVFDEICDFIGVPHHTISQNVHNASRMEEHMSPHTRAKLVEFFQRHNREMGEYLGRDFNWDW
ncbi:MAG: sulfotransferase [Gallionellaceae bacterium]